MTQDQFHKGLATIRTAIETALHERGVSGGLVSQGNPSAGAGDIEFSVTVADKVEKENFARQEIEDSALAIDAPAAVKVRMLVGPFVR